MSPIIGITCKKEEKITDYTDAIKTFGGQPRPFIPRSRDPMPDDLSEIDGLLMPGGGDIDPCRYNELRYHVKGISKIKGVSKQNGL